MVQPVHSSGWRSNAGNLECRGACDGLRTLLCTQDFRHSISNLRSEQAEPYFLDLRAWRPEFQEFGEVAEALHHLTCNCAMDRDPLPNDVLKNAIVGCRRSPHIVLRLQPINGHNYVQMREPRPSRTHRSEGAGNNLHVDSARQQQGNQQLEFAITD